MKICEHHVKAICDCCKATIICEKRYEKYKTKLCEECSLDVAMDGMIERKSSIKKLMGHFCYGS